MAGSVIRAGNADSRVTAAEPVTKTAAARLPGLLETGEFREAKVSRFPDFMQIRDAGLRRESLQTKMHGMQTYTEPQFSVLTVACESGNVNPCSLNPSAALQETRRTL